MIARIDFSLTPGVLSALLAGLAFPVCLAIAARVPGLCRRNALQFLAALTVMAGFWVVLVVAPIYEAPSRMPDLCTGLMLLVSGALLHLEAWALLSRGYTLGLLVTLYRSGRPLTGPELARRYRGGEGLAWIMRHRMAGLQSAHLVREDERLLTLTPFGTLVARLFGATLAVLGLERTD